MAGFLSGCKGVGAHAGHDHHDNLALTAYDGAVELYAEVGSLSVGHPSTVLAHFTSTGNFKPISEGAVTASLTVGQKGVRQIADEPVHPGVYKFVLTPTAAGDAELIFDFKNGEKSQKITFTGLKVYTDEHDAAHAASEAAVKSSNGVAFSKEKSWITDFATASVEKRPMSQTISTVAQVQPSQGDIRTVAAKTAGIVSFVSPDLTDGTAVRSGQPLFRIDASSMADNNLAVRYAAAKADYEAAKSNYDRVMALAADRLVTNAEIAEATNAYTTAKAAFQSLDAAFRGGSFTAAAPIQGYISGLFVTNGQHVEAGEPLATVAQNTHLFVKARLQPSYYAQLQNINGATIELDGKMVPLSDLEGSLVSYGRSVEDDSPLIPVVFKLKNTGKLIPGTFVPIAIQTGTPSQTIAVPNEALIEEMGNFFVFVQLTPEYFEKREVTAGRADGTHTEILAGITPGERVVTRGAVLLKLAQSTGTLDAHAGHVH